MYFAFVLTHALDIIGFIYLLHLAWIFSRWITKKRAAIKARLHI